MPATWVVVADSSAARIFDAGSPTGALQEVAAYAHPLGRAHERELRTDEPGMTKDRMGYAKHANQPKVSPKEHEQITFAKFIADHLEQARATSKIERVILVAPPEFLGRLRSELDHDLKKIVEGEYGLNVVRMRPEEIRGHLPERLYSALGNR